eukprot:GHVU01038055.1.p1 GENE.GHVU01038055.1~~GHVU01038055.1.p1  ORF type:complete len:129 (+),score=13.98 GHVU01038055.1:498-884(+)
MVCWGIAYAKQELDPDQDLLRLARKDIALEASESSKVPILHDVRIQLYRSNARRLSSIGDLDKEWALVVGDREWDIRCQKLIKGGLVDEIERTATVKHQNDQHQSRPNICFNLHRVADVLLRKSWQLC